MPGHDFEWKVVVVPGFTNQFEETEGGPQIKARLKWFNATKGFGFVSPVDGTPDAFLHVSVLHSAGLQHINEQAELLCEVGPGPKGPQVTRIVEVLDAGQPAGSSSGGAQRGDSGGGYGGNYGDAQPHYDGGSQGGGSRGGYDNFSGGHTAPSGPEEEMAGVVKWFKADKGFGFITADGSGTDVFIHKSVLMRSGLYSLEAGQRVQMKVQEAQKGREATWIMAD